ncbi:RND family transporter [Salinifilum aidingensis]
MTTNDGRGFFGLIGRATVRRRGIVVLLWLLAAGALNAAVPQIEQVTARDSSPMIPADSPSVRALPQMDEQFGGGGANTTVFLAFVDEGGITRADRQYCADLVQDLRRDPAVVSVQDQASQPRLSSALSSEDGKATYVPVGLRGANGSPRATEQIEHIRQRAEQGRPDDLRVHVTGPAASAADMQAEMNSSMVAITGVAVVLITTILLLIYRSVVVTGIALSMVGISLATARAVTALCGLHLFPVSTFTTAFLTAVVLGAGTDYNVFVINRYLELKRDGACPVEAVTGAVSRIGHVITASAFTVIVACSGMALADVSFFRTTGPALAVSLAVTLIAALTLTPALLGFVAARGFERARDRTDSRWWRGTARHVMRRPAVVLLAGLALLGVLAPFYADLREGFDTRAVQPASTDSNRGFDALSGHFPDEELFPEYVLIHSDHDLRNAQDLAALETAAANVAKTGGVASVRGVTRPSGTPIAAASTGEQTGRIGDRLERAGANVDRLTSGVDGLAGSADNLAGGAAELADGIDRARQQSDELLAGLEDVSGGIDDGTSGAQRNADGAAQLARGARLLATTLDMTHDQVKVAVGGLEQSVAALEQDPLCDVDPACSEARDGVREVLTAQRDELLPGIARARDAAQRLAGGGENLQQGARQLHAGLVAASEGMHRLAAGQQQFQQQLGQAETGADELARGADRLAGGAAAVIGSEQSPGAPQPGNTGQSGETGRSGNAPRPAGSIEELARGLGDAAEHLKKMGAHPADPALNGFYLPERTARGSEMATADEMFLSEDGRTARLMVLYDENPMGRAAMRTSGEINDSAEQALRGTSLDGARISQTGIGSNNRDLHRAVDHDFALFAAFALVTVLVILVLLLRSVLAPIYLMLSIVLTYAAATGISVLVWQHWIGTDLSWSVAPVTFVILVAVGADYNLLLISRIREENAHDPENGTARAMVATGSVITTAGVIFAASMFAMIFGSVDILAQIGFTIGTGLLLDTFVVRTLLIPAMVRLLGRGNWWPSRA